MAGSGEFNNIESARAMAQWCKVFLMDLWAILLTATVGLAAGQVGAWLQSRRDAQAESARQQSETERLRLQLVTSREQRERELSQADTLEWRERRLAGYQKASAGVNALLAAAHWVPDLNTAIAVSASADGCSSMLEPLSEALDVSAIVGTRATRLAAGDLSMAADHLTSTISAYDRHVSGVGKKYSALLYEVQRAARGSGDPFSCFDAERLSDVRATVGVALDDVHSASAKWHAAARSELGVPD